MATPAEIAAKFITTKIELGYWHWYFIGKEPASPIDRLTVYDTGGRDELTSLERGCGNNAQAVNTNQGRNKSYPAGYIALQAAGEALKTAQDYQYDGLILTAALKKQTLFQSARMPLEIVFLHLTLTYT